MINFLTMQDVIFDWINGETGNQCIWQFQNAPIPKKKFYALRLMSFIEIGDSDFRPSDPQTLAGEFDIVSNFDFTLEILGFGKGIMQDTVNLKASLNNPVIHEALLDGGVVSWNDTNAVLDISGIDNDLNEERSSYDAMMRTDQIISDVPLGLIEKVNIDGIYENPGKPDITTTINVDSTI